MVQTKLSVFCDKIIEAGWLTGVIVTPLFFNWYSNRVFEASKVALLRSITLVMLAAWLIKTLEAGNWELEIGRLRRASLRLRSSRWKSTLSDVLSWSKGLVEGLVLRAPLIIPTLTLAGVCILATITSVAPRVSFWGSYERRQGLYVVLCYIAIFFLILETLRTRRQFERLITVILFTSLPVSLYGVMQYCRIDPLVWVRGGARRAESTMGNPIFIGAYLIMVVPLTVRQLIRSLSPIRTNAKKGVPSLLLFGCYFLLLVLQLICLVFTQSRGPWVGLMAGALFFFLLWAVLRERRGLALAAIGVSVAFLAFLAILNLPHSPLKALKRTPYVERLGDISRDITGDRGLIWQGAAKMITDDGIRVVIGYGPETMGLIFYPYAHPDWADIFDYKRLADRCHNETCDAVVTGGLIGLVAYLILFGSIFYYGLKWLGLIANSRQRNFLIVAWLGGGSLGVLIPWLATGSLRWAGVGIPAGMLLALVLYLMATLFQREERESKNNQILLITLLSALIAHFVEIQFGIAVTATRTYFWLYAALLVVTGYDRWEHPAPAAAVEASPPDGSRGRRGRRRRGRGEFQISNFRLPNLELLVHSLLVGLVLATTSFNFINHQFDLRTNGSVIFGLLFVIWLLGGIPLLTSNLQIPTSKLSTYALGSLLCFLPFLAAHAAIALPGAGVERMVVVYYVYIFLIILAVAVTLTVGRKLYLSLFRFRAWWIYPVIGIGILLLVFNTNLKATQADIYYKFALSSEETGEIDKAIAIYRHAIQLAPRWDPYYASLGWAYGLKAINVSDVDQRVDVFEESLETLEHAQKMNPFDPHIKTRLGHVHLNWSGLISDPEQRAEKLETALAYYQQAVTLSPVIHWHQLKETITKTLLHLGAMYADLGEFSQAVEAYQKANEIVPDGYEGHRGLAAVYLQLGRLDEALEEVKAARGLAPEEEKPALDDLIAQLEAKKR